MKAQIKMNQVSLDKPRTFSINTSNRHQGVLLLNQATLQTVYEKSGPDAVSNEFQVHYYALVFRHTAEDGSILDIAVPTVMFNYPQQVTGAHIDFTLKDVKAVSEKVRPVHNTQVTKLLGTSIQQRLATLFGVKFTPVTSAVNSIHRHPGGSAHQAFSGTDLDRTVDEPGVVYPLTSGNMTPNFASIMAIDNGTCNLAHSEYRLVSSSESKVFYTEARCHSIALGVPEQLSNVEALLGQVVKTPYEVRSKESALSVTTNTSLVNILKSILLPQILINPKNVVKKQYTPFVEGKFKGTLDSWETGDTTDTYSTSRYPTLPGFSEEEEEEQVYIKMYPTAELIKMDKPSLIKVACTIDDFFGIDYTNYMTMELNDLVNTIVEGYTDINNERAITEYDKMIMQEELISIGATKIAVNNLSDEQLKKFHNEAFPD